MPETILSPRLQRRISSWLSRHGGQRFPALILGSHVNGLSFARSLGRRGVPVLLLDFDNFPGMATRYAETFHLPPPAEQHRVWISFLEEVGTRLKSNAVLFATSDPLIRWMSENRNRLRPHFRFLIPSATTFTRILDKRDQYEFCRSCGIPIPVTFSPESVSEADRIVEAVRYPCLLKPRFPRIAAARDRRKVIVIHSSRELQSHYERLFDQKFPFLIQEIVPGTDTGLFGYLALWSEDAWELAWFVKQKLRQYPPLYGDGSLQISVEAPEVVEQSRQLLTSLEYSGFVGIEFKYDERDRSYRLIEINLRTVSGNQLAISSGVDFPWIGYQYLTEDIPAVPFPPVPQIGIKYVQEAWDLRAFLLLRKQRKITLARWLQSVRKVQAKALWAKDDPLPILHVLWHGLGDEVRRIGQRFL